MKSDINNFLQEVLGLDGFSAVNKAISNSKELKSILIPRTILSWLEIQSQLGSYNSKIPGINLNLELNKSEEGFSGSYYINKNRVHFNKKELLEVASDISILLNVGEITPPTKDLDIVNLGKSVDLLIKSKILNSLKKKDKPILSDKAKPIEPLEPEPPQKQPSRSLPKIPPKTSPKPVFKSLKVSKSQSENRCSLCNKSQFKNDTFIGCDCLSEVSSLIKTEKSNNGYLLKFKHIDEDTFGVLLEIFYK